MERKLRSNSFHGRTMGKRWFRPRRRPRGTRQDLVVDLRDPSTVVDDARWRITSRHRIPASEESVWYELSVRQGLREKSAGVLAD
jgi:hypothetical protein